MRLTARAPLARLARSARIAGPAGLGVLAALIVTGCGSSDGNGATGAPDSGRSTPAATASGGGDGEESAGKSADAAQKTYEEYKAKFFSGDYAGACELLTPAYQQQSVTQSAEFTDGAPPTDCPGALRAGFAFAKAYGLTESSGQVAEAHVDGDTATVLEKNDKPFEDTLYTLTWSGDRWLIAKDESAAEASADTAKWVDNWCNVQPGMSAADAIRLMGEPTGDFREDYPDNPQLEWSADPYSFTAFLDSKDTIVQLDMDDRHLSAADKAKLPCGSARR